MTVFTNASPMLSDVTLSHLGDRQVDDAAFVGVERADLLRERRSSWPSRPGRCAICRSSASLPLPEAHAVDHQPPALGSVVPEDGRHDVLQRLQRLALPADQHVAVLAVEVDAQRRRASPRPRRSSPRPIDLRRRFCTNCGDVSSSIRVAQGFTAFTASRRSAVQGPVRAGVGGPIE